jgi:hypothetical protein
MKKILTLICCTVLLAATSCKKETVIAPTANTKTVIFDLVKADWKLSTDGASYYADLSLPEIDNYFQHNGGVLAYISFDNEATYEQIPETFDGVAYSLRHTTGGARVIAQVYDGQLPTITQPGAATIKLLLIDSDQ